ncbi:MAG: Chaperone protein DnaK [Chroococcopsis gigantea SAG 12.99]|jgi:molecular chaperone DnaK|nr:Hsp70 family protein [Chlorogloea purpurea SAG 13.99]MDV2999895.1 Chaperone protein DnaK [Chroococcopsis gigantea SAG 12.99]
MGIVEKNSTYIIGIDLGTSNSVIAVYQKGRAEILKVDDGRSTLPSVVSIVDNETTLVGKQARSRLLLDPDNTVSSIKREIGGAWKKEFPNRPGKEYTATDISAEILSKLITGAQQTSMDILQGTPRYAVICIPANFDDNQKNATIEAAKLARLEVVSLIEEPVAAAIAYALEKEREQTILIYDLGGGTFDVSILRVDSTGDGLSKFKIFAKEGVQKLGGDDFDYEIMKIASERFKQASGIDLLDLKKDQGIAKKALRDAQQKLKDKAETAKCELTESKTARIDIPNLIKDESGKVHNLEIEIDRTEFNEAIGPLLLQSKEAVEKALTNSKLTIDDVSRIILVGGSTRVPLVREMLTEMFGKEPYSDINPDTVVAAGAATFAATLSVPDDPDVKPQIKETLVVDNIVTLALGIETRDRRFNVIIPKGGEIPNDKPLCISKEYSTQRDNQTEMRISVYQSADTKDFVNDDGVTCIGEFLITKIPAKLKGEEKVTITFELDQQNLLKVKAEATSGVGGSLEINRS